MDSKLYTRLTAQEIQQDINAYNTLNSSRPPISILKKILINLTIGNIQLIEHDSIFSFTCGIILRFGTVNEGVKKLGMLIIEMYVSPVFRNNNKNHKNNNNKTNLDIELEGLLPHLVEFASSPSPDINALHILGSIDINCMSLQLFKTYTNSLWILVNEKLSCNEEKDLNIEFIHITIRLIQKIMKSESNKELREDKIKVIFNKLLNILNKFNEISIISAVSETIIDLTIINNKYPFLKLELTINHITKLISIITQLRSHESNGNLLLNKHLNQIPSLLTILTKFKINESNKNICKDIITCIKPFLNDNDLTILMNSIKCIIYYLNFIENDELFKNKIIIEIFNGFIKLFEFNNNKIINKFRTIFFNCLRNLILIIIKFNKDIKFNDKTNEIFKILILKFIKIDESIDFESYIIDTKLEILYLLSIEDIEKELIIKLLLPLIESSNNEISYKSIRTIGNLILKDFKLIYLMNELIDKISTKKNLLAISIFIKDLVIINKNYNNKIILKYINRVCNSRDTIYEMISENEFRDEDIISYIWLLGEFGEIDELIKLKQSVWDRNKLTYFNNKESNKLIKNEVQLNEMEIFTMDMYLTSLVKSWIRNSNKEDDKVLNIMKEISKISKYLLKRVNFYLRIIVATNGDKDKLQSIILIQNFPNDDNTNTTNNNKLDDSDDNSSFGLSDETVTELCTVFGSIACVYLRNVHSVFRNS